MKKIYKSKLPKDMEVEHANILIENGELVVEIELKERFEPKDGDFCVSSLGNVFIYCDKELLSSNSYCGCYCVSYSMKGQIITYYTKLHTKKNGCRYATPKEKDDFLERLEKECGKRWNPETKQLEDIRWRADKGKPYYVVNMFGFVQRLTEEGLSKDELYYNIGNYFKTSEAACRFTKQVQELFKNSKSE